MAQEPGPGTQALEQQEELQWVRPQRSIWQRMRRTWSHKPLGLFGLSVVALLFAMAILAPLITPYGPLDMHPIDRLQGPSPSYIMGTDQFGRDMYTRLVFGSQISLFMGFASITIGGTSGGLLGLLSAYMGGKFDLIVQRITDVFQAFPSLVLAMAMVAALGFGLAQTALAISFPQIPRVTRIIRSQAISVRSREYILAARALGASGPRMLLRHMAPNSAAPWLVVVTHALGAAIIAEASLSFLGLGVPPPFPSWGGMLSGNSQEYAELAPWLIIYPGIFLSIAVFGFNLFGDAVRDVMDPRLRR